MVDEQPVVPTTTIPASPVAQPPVDPVRLQVAQPVSPIQTPGQSPAEFWKAQYDETATGANTFLFFKAEKTRVRLIGIGDHPQDWVRRVESEFQGTRRYQYISLGFRVVESGSEESPILQAIVFTKGAWSAICNMMTEGYDLFSPEGLGLTVTRGNNNNRINYSLMPSPVAVPIPPEIMEDAISKDWTFYLEEHAKMQENRANAAPSSPQSSSIADQIVNAPATSSEW